VYWVFASINAARKPMWYDELETWHIAQQPTIPAMWAANSGGVDNNMLLSHLLVRASHALFGVGELATRVPAMTGFWILCLGLFVFLRRRLPVPYALAGMVLPMLTFAWKYAFEARAYAIVLASAAIALVAWQNVILNRRRRLSLVMITVGLAAALGSHPFAILLALPFASGEIARSIERRRVDWPVWIAFAAAAPVVLAYPILFAPMKSIDLSGIQPGITILQVFYSEFFEITLFPLVLAAGIAYLLHSVAAGSLAEPGGFTMPETAAVFGFLFAPAALLVVIANSHTLAFFPRYGLICVIGATALLVLAMHRIAAGNLRTGAVIFLVLMIWTIGVRTRSVMAAEHHPQEAFRKEKALLLKAIADGRPVVTNYPLTFFESDFYLPKDQANRLYYVTMPREIRRRYPWQDMSDQLLGYIDQHVPLKAHLVPWRDFAAKNPGFLLHAYDQRPCVYDVLTQGGWKLKQIGHLEDSTLYEVSAPATPAQ
jgi:hypothetical protein